MTCAECGKPSSYWLCSNACALACAKRRERIECAVCSWDPKTMRIGRHDTTKICDECRKREENDDWVHREQEQNDLLPERDLHHALARLAEQQDRPLRELTPLVRQVAALIVEGERVAYRYRAGDRVETRYRWRAYTLNRLAKKLGVPAMSVKRIVDAIES